MPKRSARVTYEIVDDQAILIDGEGRELITLNPVGTLVWVALDGTVTEQGLVEILASRFPEVERSRLAADIDTFLSELRELDLLEESDR